MRALFLPTTLEDMADRGWDAPDFIFVSGDAYVDHPSFGAAILGRTLEKAGYRVAILAQPDWRDLAAIRRLGRPKIGFMVTSGVIDSMVNHYTAAKKNRSEDAYSPGGKAGCRPDRALIVYCNLIRRAFGDIPVLVGGVEASLRRFSHYDYWDDRLRRSVLVDAPATLLCFGMGERVILACADFMARGCPPAELPQLTGVCYMAKEPPTGCLELPNHQACAADKKTFAQMFMASYAQQDPVRGKRLCQQQDDRYLVQNIPDMPLTQQELDATYALPFQRTWHPDYDELGGIPALEEVKFSIAATRGCYGGCHFCSITFHQGRIVTSRSHASVLAEATKLTHLSDFKGYIHDVGGPTANFRGPACNKQLTKGTCANRQCLFPKPCPSLKVDHSEFIQLLRKLRALPGVKKVFIRSGLRYDAIMADKSSAFLNELCEHHVSGQLKVAPEHVSPRVLEAMGKPGREVYDGFVQRYWQINQHLRKEQYLVPYLMSSHPGSDLHAAVALALYLKETGCQPEQVQDFYPTPGTLSTCMFYTGLDPRTMQPITVPRSPEDKALQRALLQYRRPQNHGLVRKALRQCGREDLIGYGRDYLVPPEQQPQARPTGAPGTRARATKPIVGKEPAHSPNTKAPPPGKASPRAKGRPGGKRRK